MEKRVVLIGAGITGLSAAYELQKHAHHHPLSTLLLESSQRLGGKIFTDVEEPFRIEAGPDSFLTSKPHAYDLCQELGLGAELLGTHPQFKRIYLFCNGKLRPVPEGMNTLIPTRIWPFLSTSLLSPAAKIRIALDLFLPRGSDEDETVAEFFRRRMGAEMVDKLVDPFLSGVYAGHSEELSLRSTLPQIHSLEKSHRSLLLGMFRQKASSSPSSEKTNFMTLKSGLGTLVYTLASRLRPGSILLGSRVKSVTSSGTGYRVSLEDGKVLAAEAVLLSTPAYESCQILKELNPTLSQHLENIPYTSSATVTLAYRHSEVKHPLDGFGFLIPRSQGKTILGATWTSTKFPGRTPEGYVLLRCFLGGSGREEILQREDHEIFQAVRKDLECTLHLTANPFLKKVYRWFRGNPQYKVGHDHQLKEIEEKLKQHPGLFLAGAAFRGIGIPDCIRQGKEAAEKILEQEVGESRGFR
ncbi:MAG: protoporphyrinogen oxidase [Elusimicrobia bacterium]|nr:protoporphyrinogen oxidase [Elusimicrobiota bacterium]